MRTTRKALETSLYWQEHVLANSKDPAQKKRAQAAIEKLKQELEKCLQSAS